MASAPKPHLTLGRRSSPAHPASPPARPRPSRHKGPPTPPPGPAPPSLLFTCARGRGHGLSWASRPWGVPGRRRSECPGAARPVPVARPAGPGVRRAQLTPSAPASILGAPGTPIPHSRRPPDCRRLEVRLHRAASARVPPAAHAQPLAAEPRVSGHRRLLRGAGRPGAPPPQVRPAPPTAPGKSSSKARTLRE